MINQFSTCGSLLLICVVNHKTSFFLLTKAFKTVTFLILCTAVVKSRISVYEGLFNPILSDSFGFSEDVTVYFFVIILISPLLGGLLL